jgi:heptaprenyl diphosphate synthase
VIDIAAAAELIHTASLIHDDIIDQADTRRGVSTLNSIQGNHTAVLAGDFLFATAFGLLANCRCPGALTALTGAIRDMCQAEIEQKETRFHFSVTENAYLSRIEKKTASLLAACCYAGAQAGDHVHETVASLAAYGRNLGLCFQITDDLLDFTGDSATLGKPAGSDLAQGILTLPVIYLLHNSVFEHGSEIGVPDPELERLQEIVQSNNCSPQDQHYITQAVRNTPALHQAHQKALYFAREAAGCLSGITPDRRQVLLDLLDQVLHRRH